MKKLGFLFLIVMFTLPLAAQDTAPDQTAPDQTNTTTSTTTPEQPKTSWKDRWNKLKSTSSLLPTPQNNGDCSASALFGMGECSIMVNGGRDNLAWERDASGMQRVFFTQHSNSGQGRGGSMDYLGQVKGQDTYYLRSSDENDTYKVEGNLKNAHVTEAKGDPPTGLIGGSEEANATQDDNNSGNIDDILKPIGTPVVGYEATAFITGKGWVKVTIDQVDKGQIVRFHDKDNNGYKVVGSKFVADGTH